MEESIDDLVDRIIDSNNRSVHITRTDLVRLLQANRAVYEHKTMSYILPYDYIGGACKAKVIISKTTYTNNNQA
jgi:hypothetical protein